MKYQDFAAAVDQFQHAASAHKGAIAAKMDETSDAIDAAMDSLRAFIAQETEALTGKAEQAKVLFGEALEYAQMLEAEAARLRREATAFATTIDPPPIAPGDMQIEFSEQAQ